MNFNPETVLDALNEFEKRPYEVTPVLEEYLLKIAKTGNIIFPWNKVKPLLKRKLELVLNDFCENCPPNTIPSLPNSETFNFDYLKSTIMEALDMFPNAPFTIQRLCELVTNPKKHYNRTDKYMRGLEKNVLVVSTVGFSPLHQNENITNQFEIVNGVLSSGNSPPHSEINYSGDHYDSNEVTPIEGETKSVNGTVLDNFASVFPTAPCISASPKCSMVSFSISDSHMYEQTTVDHFGISESSNSSVSMEENDCPISSIEKDAETSGDITQMSVSDVVTEESANVSESLKESSAVQSESYLPNEQQLFDSNSENEKSHSCLSVEEKTTLSSDSTKDELKFDAENFRTENIETNVETSSINKGSSTKNNLYCDEKSDEDNVKTAEDTQNPEEVVTSEKAVTEKSKE